MTNPTAASDREVLLDVLYGHLEDCAGVGAAVDAIIAEGFGRAGWIACSERMPTGNEQVIVSIEMNDGEDAMSWSAFWNGERWRDQGATRFDGAEADTAGVVTHWRPFPVRSKPPVER